MPSRRSEIAPFIVMEVMAAANARAASGEDVLHLEVGEPGGGAPAKAIEAATRAMTENARLGYSEAFGLPELRERISRHYAERHGVQVSPSRIAVTAGASGAFILAFLAAFDAGARVALADPGYPAYRNILKALGIEAVGLPSTARDRFQPTVELLEKVEGRIDGLIVASPANPTGTMLSAEEQARLVAWCDANGVRLIADEIYHGLTYGRPETTLAGDGSKAIVVNSFSKFFGMTGWRVGWMVMPEELIAPVQRLAQNLFISASAVGQHAALGAFDDIPALEARVERCARNREKLLAALKQGGLTRVAPADGAFYIYADISDFSRDSVAFCKQLLEETGIAITPGTDFDPARGHDFVRLSFAGDAGQIETACGRLVDWLTSRPRLAA